MGWTFTHKQEGQSAFEFFEPRLAFNNADRSGRLLDLAVVNRREAYGAFEVKNHLSGERRVIALVILLQYASKDYNNFGFKEMDESWGPLYYNCPERIFKKLTPLKPSETEALAWREKVQQVLKLKFKAGDIIDFTPALKMSNGTLMHSAKITSTSPWEVYSEDLGWFVKVSKSYLKDQILNKKAVKREPQLQAA